jgi:hypothetical protein
MKTQPQKPKLPANFQPVQEFEVLVEGVGKKNVRVRLVDLTDGKRPDESADIRIKELPEVYREKLHPGLIFYWGIGRYHDQIVDKMNSVFDFDYAGRVTQKDLDDARRKGEELLKKISLGSARDSFWG